MGGVLIPLLLIFSIGLSASGSFRRERELGVMELLLVTPLSVGQIICGRLRGLWSQFLPAVLLLMAMWLYLVSGRGLGDAWEDDLMAGGFFAWLLGVSLLTLPVTGLYFSLRCRHYIVALFMTLLVGEVLPFFVMISLYEFFHVTDAMMVGAIVPAVLLPTLGFWIFAWWRFADYRGTIGRAAGFFFFLTGFFVLADSLSSRDLLSAAIRGDGSAGLLLFPAIQCALAALFGVLLHRSLVNRSFAFHV